METRTALAIVPLPPTDWPHPRTPLAEPLFVAGQELAAHIRLELEGLPYDALFEGDLPVYPQRAGYEPIKLFPLGPFNYAQMGGLTGRTTLYVGDNGGLYEYGPLHPRWNDTDEYDSAREVREHTMRLWQRTFKELSVPELIEIRVLLRQLWVLA